MYLDIQKNIIFAPEKIALLCNGSTADSGSVCSGSSPDGATTSKNKCLTFKYESQAFMRCMTNKIVLTKSGELMKKGATFAILLFRYRRLVRTN